MARSIKVGQPKHVGDKYSPTVANVIRNNFSRVWTLFQEAFALLNNVCKDVLDIQDLINNTDKPLDVGTKNIVGKKKSLARSDHVHDHGQLPGGDLHECVTDKAAGFMCPEDKILLDSLKQIDHENFIIKGSLPQIGSQLGGTFVPCRGGKIKCVKIHRLVAGSAGSTICDVNINGVTIFTTQANRPAILFSDGDDFRTQSGAINIEDFVDGDQIEVELDSKENGNAKTVSVIVEVEYTITP